MSRRPAVGSPHSLRRPVPFPLVGVGLLLALPILSMPSAFAPAPPANRTGLLPDLSANLTVVPADWWMTGGASKAISAAWTDIPPACTVRPVWFQWSVAPGESQGWVAPTNGSTTNFTAAGTESGTTEVVVAGAAGLTCGPNRTAAFGTATATFHVDAPLVVQEFRTVPDSPRSTGNVEVSGTIAGGDPPYAVTVAWGDGNVTTVTESTEGNFSVVGQPGSGSFDPSVIVTDSAGLIARATVEESVAADDGFAVSIVPSSYMAEVGVPVDFGLRSTAPPGEYSMAAACEDAAEEPEGPPAAVGTDFSCTFADPGIANVSVLAIEAVFPFATASAVLLEPVVPTLSVETAPTGTEGEVGRQSYVPLTLVGGVPPYRVHWRFVGNGSQQTATVPLNGTFLAPVTPAVAGTEELAVTAVDALGVPAANASAPIDVEGTLAGEASAQGIAVEGGTGFLLSAAVVAGTPPFEWTVVPATSLANESAVGGVLASADSFAWNGTIRAEGMQNVTLVVVDTAGKLWVSNLSVAPVASMVIEVQAAAGPPGRWIGDVDISGGSAPFLVWVNGSDGESWNRSGLVDGLWRFAAQALAPGNLSISVTVVDRLGIVARASATVNVPPQPESPSSPTSTIVEAAGLFGALGGGVVLWRWRRSGSREKAPEIDVVAALREIIAPADGADRAVVELLAEERGIPLPTVRSSIDRLIADGTIRAERGPDGEEVLAWRTGP